MHHQVVLNKQFAYRIVFYSKIDFCFPLDWSPDSLRPKISRSTVPVFCFFFSFFLKAECFPNMNQMYLLLSIDASSDQLMNSVSFKNDQFKQVQSKMAIFWKILNSAMCSSFPQQQSLLSVPADRILSWWCIVLSALFKK